ncbi:hypothetical protein BDZ97DRAFT_1791330 [Flammula alnicola]|nr:hypothetical protein BDZ97DRAFT_1791330 [Flammula alnicola]
MSNQGISSTPTGTELVLWWPPLLGPVVRDPGTRQATSTSTSLPRTLNGYQIPNLQPAHSPRSTRSPQYPMAYKSANATTSTPSTTRNSTVGNLAHKSASKIPSNGADATLKYTATKTVSPSGWATKAVGSPSKHTTPRSALRDGATGSPTPSRVRFAQHKTANWPRLARSSYPMSTKTSGTSQPARISSQPSALSSQGARRHSMTAHSPFLTSKKTTKTTEILNAKSSSPLKPLWQQLDDEYEEERLRYNKRDRDGNAFGFSKRTSSNTGRRGAEIAPALKLRVNGEIETSGSDDDEPRYRPQARLVNRKTAGRQIAAKKSAARKVEYTNATSSESEDFEAENNSSEQIQDDRPPDSDVDMEEPMRGFDAPDILIAAVEALSLSAVRMQGTSQLPFLLRNLREGFLKRCRKMQVPIFTDGRAVTLSVRYEYVAGAMYQTKVSSWRCPLCNFLGTLKTQEMLDCHLKWDHAEVYREWHKTDETDQIEFWELRLLIPEVQRETDNTDHPDTQALHVSRAGTPPNELLPSIYTTPQQRNSLSPFPSVSLSPPSAPRAPDPDVSITPSIRSTPLNLSSRSRSTTGTVTSLFDLLGTLPMEPFGVLDWDVLDREEEIYESDDVKDEYKVMHALWARWIMLNRNKFISNYYKGVISFVDEYWKFIHKAAGWDALRYWLYTLLANQFLNGHELAKVLLHYEGLTGMAYWYE